MIAPTTFDSDTFEHTATSGRTFKLRTLNAFEQLQADSLSKNLNSAFYYRVAMALVAINGEELLPANSDLTITSRLESLGGSEVDQLTVAYIEHASPRGEDLKK